MDSQPAPNEKPRLVIQRLQLENFKSYAGVQHIGPFHKASPLVAQVMLTAQICKLSLAWLAT